MASVYPSGSLLYAVAFWLTGPYTEYKIQVAAITGGGRGPFSEKYPALTDVAGKLGCATS